MAQNYKVRLKRWNGTDFDVLNLSSQNILMNSGTNVETAINSKPSINDSSATSSSVWSGEKTQTELTSVSTNAKPRIATVSLSSTWSGSGPYTQTVTIAGQTITAKTKVDVQPNSTVITNMMNNNVYSLYIENNNGTLTAYAVGGKTSTSLSLQVSLVEVQ